MRNLKIGYTLSGELEIRVSSDGVSVCKEDVCSELTFSEVETIQLCIDAFMNIEHAGGKDENN